MSALLRVDGLTVDLASDTGAVSVLHGVSVAIDEGETVGLVGESGSGKSTTARAVLRLLGDGASMGGAIELCGTDVLAASDTQMRRLRADRVALVQQDPRAALNPVRRIGDSMVERLVLVRGVDRTEALDRAEAILAAVGISHPRMRLRQHPHELSGGMLQRVVIATGMLADPDLILADEATSALDVTTQAEVIALLRRQQRDRGLGVLLITHDLHLAAASCDRVVVMRDGRDVETLDAATMFESARDAYTRTLVETAPRLRRSTS